MLIAMYNTKENPCKIQELLKITIIHLNPVPFPANCPFGRTVSTGSLYGGFSKRSVPHALSQYMYMLLIGIAHVFLHGRVIS